MVLNYSKTFKGAPVALVGDFIARVYLIKGFRQLKSENLIVI